MSKDPPYDRRVGDQRDQPTPRATGRASEDVDLEESAQHEWGRGHPKLKSLLRKKPFEVTIRFVLNGVI